MENDRKIKAKFWCHPCITVDNEEREAVAFCVGCADYLCTNCTSEHGKNKQSRNHAILKGNDMPGDCKIYKDMKRLMTCQVHTDIDVSYRCVDHDMFVCMKCVTDNHRGCKEIEDVCNIELNSEDLIERLKEESTNVRAVLTQKHQNIAWMASEKTRIEKETKEIVERVNKHILKLIEAFQKHLEMVAQNAVRDLTKEINKCTDIAKRDDYYQDLVEVAVKHGTHNEKITVTDFVGKELQRLIKNIKELSHGKIACLRFEPTTQFEGILSFGDIIAENIDKDKAIGRQPIEVSNDEFTEQEKQPESTVSNMKKLPRTPNEESSRQAEPNMSDKKQTRTSFMSRPIRKTSTYKVRTNRDTVVCSVNRMVVIEDKGYIVTDCSNMKVKLLRNDFTVSISVVLKAIPIDICRVGNTRVVVLSDNKMIFIFDINKESIFLTASHDITLQGLSITCDTKQQELMIIFFKASKKEGNSKDIGELQVYSLENYSEMKRKTNTFETCIGYKSILPDSASIHFSNKRKLFISSKKGVHCLNMQFSDTLPEEEWFYKAVKDVTDIDTDNEGNAYICEKTSCNIHQVSEKTYNKNRVLISNITNPLSVCVDSQNELLLIGCDGDDYIHVYKFQ